MRRWGSRRRGVGPVQRGVPSNPPPRSIWQDAVNLPNLLTFGRVAMIPLVLLLLADGTRRASFWATMVYVLSAVTDALDGWLARRRGLVSVLGKFLDPLADKLLVMATLVFMVYMGRLPLLGTVAVIVLLGRELAVTSLRTIAMSEGVVIAAGQGGKEKAALQMLAILLLMLHYPYEMDFFVARLHVDMHAAGLVLLYLSVVLAITSAGEYTRLFVQAVEAKERRLRSEE